MDINAFSNEWFTFGDMDYEAAQYLLDMPKRSNEIICYHCQQSAEKYLKGYIFIQGAEAEKTHNLISLCKKCIEFDKEFEAIMDECSDLTSYAVMVRYPFHIDLEEADVLLAIKNVSRIIDFIKSKTT